MFLLKAAKERHRQQSLAGAPAGTLIGKVAVNDGLDYRLNGRSEFVTFNPTNGEIRSALILDRESVSLNGSFNIILVAQPAAIISVHVDVLDVNDNDPIFPSSFMVCCFLVIYLVYFHLPIT